jgi:hypothetical protein
VLQFLIGGKSVTVFDMRMRMMPRTVLWLPLLSHVMQNSDSEELRACDKVQSAVEYEPKKIKMAITGNGNASKEQVAKMLQQLLGLKELPKNLDSTDGLAAAVCHFFNSGKTVGEKSYTGWDAFVKENEKRVKK